MRVYVKNLRGQTLMPCSPRKARVLLKQETTIKLWKHYYSELKKQFWKEYTFWSDGYFCCSIGNASIDTVKKYIREQG